MGSIRVVIFGAQEVAWELRSSFGADATISTHATQRDAIAAGRTSLMPAGGMIVVYGLDGQIRRNIRVPERESLGTRPSPNSAVSKSSAAPLSPLVAGADIASSVWAHANGGTHDANEDGRDDGEVALTSLLDTNDGSPANLFFKGTGRGINLLLILLLPGLAAFVGVSIQGTEVLGTTYWTVYLATIAWSGGISVASFVGFLSPQGWGAGHYLGTILGGFAVSSGVAGIIGGSTIASPATLALPELHRLLVVTPKNKQGGLALLFMMLLFVIWLVALAGLATYGPLGLILGAVVGVAIGWQAAHRVQTALLRQAQQPPDTVST
ncbi:DUF2188 domain-containing protein [Cryobacterium sp. Hb1]|uniref:DUF2188 domain-containing protein n=1 Tax=Cryobacterium sp. Hb1 TaxID=1259147 RepID=UPI0011001760|nr:DUF2188 domain-containing protein [Cryobacterium sp. Hb1]TFD70498.1 DUF2188 domain-containing protein [Cryobacterium sp. Hb1]